MIVEKPRKCSRLRSSDRHGMFSALPRLVSVLALRSAVPPVTEVVPDTL